MDAKSIEALKTKGELVKALKDSCTYEHAAVSTITPANAFLSVSGPPAWKMTRASTAAFAMAHSMDHYGQMVEYLRMNGRVPPASRPRSGDPSNRPDPKGVPAPGSGFPWVVLRSGEPHCLRE
ncbi:MAG TPA: hypothetical protein VHZ09_16610 [Acidobacteriaceae bacterium]|nr:hypothetical protein [Acidobacteriaceae bacterium]